MCINTVFILKEIAKVTKPIRSGKSVRVRRDQLQHQLPINSVFPCPSPAVCSAPHGERKHLFTFPLPIYFARSKINFQQTPRVLRTPECFRLIRTHFYRY